MGSPRLWFLVGGLAMKLLAVSHLWYFDPENLNWAPCAIVVPTGSFIEASRAWVVLQDPENRVHVA